MTDILIVRTSSLGDIVHSLPLPAALKEFYPACRVTWAVERRYQDVLTGNPWVDRIIPVRFKEWKEDLRCRSGRQEWQGMLRGLRRTKYDVAIDSQGLARSGILSYLSRAPVRIGFPARLAREPLNALFTNVRPESTRLCGHVIDSNLALLHPLGIRTRQRSCWLHIPEDVEAEVQCFLEKTAPAGKALRLAVHPGAGWRTKQWPIERYAAVARRAVRERGAALYVFWGPGERELAERLQRLLPPGSWLVPEMGIKAALAFLRGCDLFLGGDSGPLHLASALGTPTVGLFGPSDPVRNGPFLGRFRVVRGPALCAPCYRRTCEDTACMHNLSTDQVWQALADLMDEIEAVPGKEADVPRREELT